MTPRERAARERLEEAVKAREMEWRHLYGCPNRETNSNFNIVIGRYRRALAHLLRVTREEATRGK